MSGTHTRNMLLTLAIFIQRKMLGGPIVDKRKRLIYSCATAVQWKNEKKKLVKI